MKIKLNLGCGNKIINDFIGVDRYFCEGANIIADVVQLPFKNSSISEILLDNVIEHIFDITQLMKEIYRVSKNGAIITIRTPHFSSLDSWVDPTHYHHLSYFSIDYFAGKSSNKHYIGTNFEIVEKHLTFGGLWNMIGKLIFKFNPKKYEKRWCFIFRAGTLTFKLKTIK